MPEDIISPLDTSARRQTAGNHYEDFAADVRWIKERVRAEYESLPAAIQSVAQYYLTQRVKVLHERDPLCSAHHLSPRPIPYLAFWFADAFGLEDTQVRRLLGLSLVYVCLSASPRDDLLDGSNFAPPQQMYLAFWFWEKYFHVLRKLFPADSPIWYILSRSTADWRRGERWALYRTPCVTTNPFSANFLQHTSKYLVALIFPTLAGVALLGNQAEKIRVIRRFACYYCMGWRILDDLRDWRDDTLEADTQSSSVLSFLRRRAGISKNARLTREMAVSLFSDPAVVGQIYSAMARFCLAAKREAVRLGAGLVTRFIDEQLLGYEEELARMTSERIKFSNSLAQLLEVRESAS